METIGWIIVVTYIISIIIIMLYFILFIFQIITPAKLQIDLGMVTYPGRFFISLIQFLYSPIALSLFVGITMLILFCYILYIIAIAFYKIFRATFIFKPVGCKIYKGIMKIPPMTAFKKIGFFYLIDQIAKGANVDGKILNLVYNNVVLPYSKKYPNLDKKIKENIDSNEKFDISQLCGEKLFKDANGNDIDNHNDDDDDFDEHVEKEKNDNYAQCMRGSQKPITPDMSDVMVSVTNTQNQFSSINCAFLHG